MLPVMFIGIACLGILSQTQLSLRMEAQFPVEWCIKPVIALGTVQLRSVFEDPVTYYCCKCVRGKSRISGEEVKPSVTEISSYRNSLV